MTFSLLTICMEMLVSFSAWLNTCCTTKQTNSRYDDLEADIKAKPATVCPVYSKGYDVKGVFLSLTIKIKTRTTWNAPISVSRATFWSKCNFLFILGLMEEQFYSQWPFLVSKFQLILPLSYLFCVGASVCVGVCATRLTRLTHIGWLIRPDASPRCHRSNGCTVAANVSDKDKQARQEIVCQSVTQSGRTRSRTHTQTNTLSTIRNVCESRSGRKRAGPQRQVKLDPLHTPVAHQTHTFTLWLLTVDQQNTHMHLKKKKKKKWELLFLS